uniref:LP10936p n=1 Tax=Drosophila melanogaster TaxID=7227 RepID=Q95R92_DROME|nr:LP10936p [Drosophila melanogaster]
MVVHRFSNHGSNDKCNRDSLHGRT